MLGAMRLKGHILVKEVRRWGHDPTLQLLILAQYTTNNWRNQAKIGKKGRTAVKLSVFVLLQALLVGLDHFLDHLAADGAGFPGGQVAVVAVLQIHADLPWCTYYIVNSPDQSVSTGLEVPGTNSRTGSLAISPMNL